MPWCTISDVAYSVKRTAQEGSTTQAAAPTRLCVLRTHAEYYGARVTASGHAHVYIGQALPWNTLPCTSIYTKIILRGHLRNRRYVITI